ncbi:DUF6879 family protein [Nonomuraea sp. NPDC050691]|uniref:DUF6879 family protein n=1 Tax=Nonomuraea sp. NPDC050691 TaxID=3155661 RepID=UPI0033D8B5F8
MQGWKITDREALETLKDVPDHETFLEVPRELMRHLPKEWLEHGDAAPTRDDFRALWLRRRRAFHLELRDSYGVEDEEGPFRRWLLGEPDDYQWHQSWLSFARRSTRRGTAIQRARIVTEPLSDSIKWAMTIDPQNIEAGEDIRYLPRHQAADIHLPEEDYWLLDEDTLVLSLFRPDHHEDPGPETDDE